MIVEFDQYCLFCLSGREQSIIQQINKIENHFALYLMIECHEYHKGLFETHNQVVFPGYVFIYVLGNLSRQEILSIPSVIKFLTYDSGDYMLQGEDAKFAKWILDQNGMIGKSNVVRVGDRIRVVDGPMKDFAGSITMVNKQRRRAKVDLLFYGITRSVWMAFDWIMPEKQDNKPVIR